jgi:STE24 endopeptidase
MPYFPLLVAIFIALGYEVPAAVVPGQGLDPVRVLILTIVIVALAPVPGILLASTIHPERLADSFERMKVARRLRTGMLLYQVWLLGSFAVIIYAVGWPDLIERDLGLRRLIVVREILRLVPYLVMLVLAWIPGWRIDRVFRRGAWSLREYLEFHFRQYVLFVLVWFILVVAVIDVFDLIPSRPPFEKNVLDLVALGVIAVLFVCAPFFIRIAWKTHRLEDGPLRQMLSELCTGARVRYLDILVWETLGGQIANASVTGFVPPIRYLMLTDALMEMLSPDEIRAVFAHEVGHVRLHHIVFYVLLAVGFGALVTLIAATPFVQALDRMGPSGALSPSNLVVIALLVLYWGGLFGFVSRRMELEADCFAVQTTGNVFDFVNALEQISFSSGRPRSAGSWNHFSVARRVEFLLAAAEHPELLREFLAHMRIARWAIVSLAVLSSAAAVVVVW